MKKLAVGCLSIFIVIAVAAGGWIWTVMQELPTLDTRLEAPAQVPHNAVFDLTVHATNNHEAPVELFSLDVDNRLLRGFQVVHIVPYPTDAHYIPSFDQRRWQFERKVEPGETIPVTLTLHAVKVGRFIGNIDVCNPNIDYTSVVPDIIVKANEEREAEPLPTSFTAPARSRDEETS